MDLPALQTQHAVCTVKSLATWHLTSIQIFCHILLPGTISPKMICWW